MLAEANKDLARRSWELMDNLDIIDEVYAPEHVQNRLPDLHATVEDVLAEGDKVVTGVTIRSTH